MAIHGNRKETSRTNNETTSRGIQYFARTVKSKQETMTLTKQGAVESIIIRTLVKIQNNVFTFHPEIII